MPAILRKRVYVPYDAGGKAMAGLQVGDTQVLSTGFSEALVLSRQGEVRILAVTSEKRLSQAPEVPPLKELGDDVACANWRGFFGAPKLPVEITLDINLPPLAFLVSPAVQ